MFSILENVRLAASSEPLGLEVVEARRMVNESVDPMSNSCSYVV